MWSKCKLSYFLTKRYGVFILRIVWDISHKLLHYRVSLSEIKQWGISTCYFPWNTFQKYLVLSFGVLCFYRYSLCTTTPVSFQNISIKRSENILILYSSLVYILSTGFLHFVSYCILDYDLCVHLFHDIISLKFQDRYRVNGTKGEDQVSIHSTFMFFLQGR